MTWEQMLKEMSLAGYDATFFIKDNKYYICVGKIDDVAAIEYTSDVSFLDVLTKAYDGGK